MFLTDSTKAEILSIAPPIMSIMRPNTVPTISRAYFKVVPITGATTSLIKVASFWKDSPFRDKASEILSQADFMPSRIGINKFLIKSFMFWM